MNRRFAPLTVVVLLLAWSIPGWSAPMIHEIMYHPGDPEDPREEFVEIFNPDTVPVSLTGWRLRGGVDFDFPEVTIESGGFVVVVADVEVFTAKYPGVPAYGPWDGKLSNSGETLRLVDAMNEEIDELRYADDGDWSQRVRGLEDRGHRGWIWEAAHDGTGASLELVQPGLTNRRVSPELLSLPSHGP